MPDETNTDEQSIDPGGRFEGDLPAHLRPDQPTNPDAAVSRYFEALDEAEDVGAGNPAPPSEAEFGNSDQPTHEAGEEMEITTGSLGHPLADIGGASPEMLPEWLAEVVVSHRRGRRNATGEDNGPQSLQNTLNLRVAEGWDIVNVFQTKPGCWRVLGTRLVSVLDHPGVQMLQMQQAEADKI